MRTNPAIHTRLLRELEPGDWFYAQLRMDDRPALYLLAVADERKLLLRLAKGDETPLILDGADPTEPVAALVSRPHVDLSLESGKLLRSLSFSQQRAPAVVVSGADIYLVATPGAYGGVREAFFVNAATGELGKPESWTALFYTTWTLRLDEGRYSHVLLAVKAE